MGAVEAQGNGGKDGSESGAMTGAPNIGGVGGSGVCKHRGVHSGVASSGVPGTPVPANKLSSSLAEEPKVSEQRGCGWSCGPTSDTEVRAVEQSEALGAFAGLGVE